MLTEVSSLTWTEFFEIKDAVRTDTMSIEGSKIKSEKLTEMTNQNPSMIRMALKAVICKRTNEDSLGSTHQMEYKSTKTSIGICSRTALTDTFVLDDPPPHDMT